MSSLFARRCTSFFEFSGRSQTRSTDHSTKRYRVPALLWFLVSRCQKRKVIHHPATDVAFVEASAKRLLLYIWIDSDAGPSGHTSGSAMLFTSYAQPDESSSENAVWKRLSFVPPRHRSIAKGKCNRMMFAQALLGCRSPRSSELISGF